MRFFFMIVFILELLDAKAFVSFTKNEMIKRLTAVGALHNQNGVGIKVNRKKQAKKTTDITYNKDTYSDVVMYNLIKNDNAQVNSITAYNYAQNINFMDNNKKQHDLELRNTIAMINKQQQMQYKAQKNKIYNLSGYCSLPTSVIVQRIQAYAMLTCQLNNNKLGIVQTKMFISFVPIFNKLALIGKPIYLKENGNKLPIKNGVILTANQTNLNLATFINDTKIKSLLAKMMLTTNDIAYTTSVNYLHQVQQSKTQQQMVTIPSTSGTTTVQTTNTQSPDLDTYLSVAGIQLVSSIINSLGNFYLQNNYPLYKVARQSEFYVDFQVNKKGNTSTPINYQVNIYKKLNPKIQHNFSPNQNGTNPYVPARHYSTSGV